MTGGVDSALYLGFGAYLLLTLIIGAVTVRYMKSLDDFVLGGRRLGPWVAAISERASGESAWFLLGLPGAAYAAGFREFWSVIGVGFGVLASWTFIAVRLRRATGKSGALTIPGFLAARFPDGEVPIRLLSSVIILFFYTVYVGAQFVGAGKILHATFGLSEPAGMVVGAAVVLLYTLLGGFLAVAWTDLFQGLLMAAVAIVLPVLALIQIGGPSEVPAALASRGPDFLLMNAGQTGRAFVFGVMIGGLSWGLGYFGQPHLLTRYMAIQKTADLRKGSLIALGWVLAAYWGAAFIGIAGVAILGPDLVDQEQVMPLLAQALVPAWLAGLFISGAVAAMMSSADSQLLVATSSLTEDVYVRLLKRGNRPGSHSTLVRLGRAAAVAVTGVALLMAFTSSDLIFDMVAYAWSGLGSSFGPVILLALWWRGMNRVGAVSGLLTGLVSVIVWKHTPGLNDFLDLKAASFVLALAAAWLGSLAGKRQAGK